MLNNIIELLYKLDKSKLETVYYLLLSMLEETD